MRKLTESIKSLLMIVLGLAVPILWTAYIYIQFDPADNKSLQLENSFWIFTEDVQHSETVADKSYFSPEAVSIVLSGKAYTSAHNPQLTETLHNNCTSLITEVFSSSYVCEDSNAETWDKALEYSDFILVEYPSRLPYTYIAEFLLSEKGFCSGEICYIRKLILFNDNGNILSALATDGNGNIYSFRRDAEEAPSLIYDFNSNNIAAYTVNEGFIPFEFNRKTFENLPTEYKLLQVAPSLPSVTVETPLRSILDGTFGENTITYLEMIEDETLIDIFNVFDINPNIVGYYSDLHSGLYFVGEDMHLLISPDGKVSYSVTDKNTPAISTAMLLDTTRTDFTSDEILTAATVFVSSFPSDILGGSAKPLLEKVTYSSANKEIKFTFGYYYLLAGVLYNGDSNAITLTFNNKGLLRADFVPMNVSESTDTVPAEPSLLTTDTLPSLAAQLLDGKAELQPIYEFDTFGKAVTPYWAAGGR